MFLSHPHKFIKISYRSLNADSYVLFVADTLSFPHYWNFGYLMWTLNFIFQLGNAQLFKSYSNSFLDRSLVNGALHLNLPL